MDNRADLIRALGNAFTEPKKDDDNRLMTESMNIDNHSYARIVEVNEENAEKAAFINYPEAASIKNLAGLLASTHDIDAGRAGKQILSKFLEYAAHGDGPAIDKMIETVRSLAMRLNCTKPDSPQYPLVLLYIEQEIAKM